MPSIRFICVTALLLSSAGHAAVDDDEDKSMLSPVAVSSNASGIHIEESAGITTQRLEPAVHQPEFSAYGSVLNLEPLLSLRQDYLAAQAQRESASAKYLETESNLNRTRNLYQHDIVSTRRLQEQQAQWQQDKANLSTSSNYQQTILEASRLQWGDTLTHWFTQNPSKQAEQFLSHRAQLIQITLPANTHLPDDIRNIYVDEHGRRNQAIPATLIAPAPQVDPVTQGERYFFKSEGRRLPFGTHLSVWIASDTAGRSGVTIPENAVVWHLGQAFVFVKTEHGEFRRRLLTGMLPSKGGYFAASGFVPGEEIVIAGAQTLLSQELKDLIPKEDED